MEQTKNQARLLSFSKIVVAVLIANLFFASAAFSQSRLTKEISNENESAPLVAPRYQIYEITNPNSFTASQAFGISNAGVATGRYTYSGGSNIFSAMRGFGFTGHPNLEGRPFCVGNATTQTSMFGGGVTVGTCSTTLFGTSRLPVLWRNGSPTQLALPSGETLGDAYDVNAGEISVGSVNSGSLQKAVYYTGTTAATLISQTTSGGSFFVNAYGINDSNRIVGAGIDPSNAARNVGMVFDIGSGTAFEVGALSGANGAINFGIGNGGHIVGASMLNQGAGLPFIWTQATGMVAIPLPTGTSQGSARGVNTAGWAVGTASSAFAIPFLYDGTNTYRLQDLIPSNTGWDLSTNTSSSAMAINDSNFIVGTGVLNGQTRGYIMVPGVANFIISGRVTTSDGRGIPNARMTISGGGLPGQVTALTNAFGYYRFDNLQSDVAYTVTVSSKQYTFATPTRDVLASRNDVDFTAQ